RHVDAFPYDLALVVGLGGRVGMGEGHYLHDADDLLADVGVVEEGLVAEFHRLHVVARRVAAHAVPFLVALPDKIGPAEDVGLRLHQPLGHRLCPQPLARLLMVSFQGRTSKLPKTPLATKGSLRNKASASPRFSASMTTIEPVASPFWSTKGPAK